MENKQENLSHTTSLYGKDLPGTNFKLCLHTEVRPGRLAKHMLFFPVFCIFFVTILEKVEFLEFLGLKWSETGAHELVWTR